jgi:hypothetical protein
MIRHPIPKRASLTLEPSTADIQTDAKALAPPSPARKTGCAAPALVGVAAVLLLYMVWNGFVVPAYTNITDNFAYGKARISETTADVGHGGQSTFIGLVENGQIVVIELAGNPPKPVVYVVGQTEAGSRVVTVSFQDVTGNGKPDMIVNYDGNRIVLFNKGGTFKANP